MKMDLYIFFRKWEYWVVTGTTIYRSPRLSQNGRPLWSIVFLAVEYRIVAATIQQGDMAQIYLFVFYFHFQMGLAATLLHMLPESRVLLIVLLVLLFSTWFIRRQRNLPPGPWSYPFIGNLLDILDGRCPFCLKFMEYKYVVRNFNLEVYILNQTWMLLIMMKTLPSRSQSIFGVEGSIHMGITISAIPVGHLLPWIHVSPSMNK